MDTSKHIALVKVEDYITVRVLGIHYDAVLKCDRDCSLLDEARDGSIICKLNEVTGMVNFQTKTLLIDYEVIMDKKAPDDKFVHDSDFKIVDNDGHIHRGRNICDRMIDIEKGVDGSGDMIYPGTRLLFRVHYDSFPKGQKVTSIIVEMSNLDAVRINFSSDVALQDYEEGQQEPGVIPVPHEIYERIDKLEKEVSSLKRIVRLLTESKASRERYESDPNRPMSDPGIGYHPLDTK